MATVVKMCDMDLHIATKVFEALNPGKVKIVNTPFTTFILTDIEPKDLVYPEGWYYAKGYFRNKHMSTTGLYSEVSMRTEGGASWSEKARYCTLD